MSLTEKPAGRDHKPHTGNTRRSEHHAELIARVGWRVDEWAEATGTSRATVYRRLADGSLRSRQYGGVTLILGFAGEGPAES